MSRRSLTAWAFLAAFALSAPAQARSPYAGTYRVAEGPDSAGMLDLRPDGSFRYALSEGALDEQAEGTWTETAGDIRLTSDPRPVAPVFARGPDAPPGAATIQVRLEDRRELAGIDFRLGLVDGATLAGYTQAEGWSFATAGDRQIAWVELHEPIHGITSERIVIDPPVAGGLVFVLIPNDIGTVDFRNTPLERRTDDFLLDRGGRKLRLVRAR